MLGMSSTSSSVSSPYMLAKKQNGGNNKQDISRVFYRLFFKTIQLLKFQVPQKTLLLESDLPQGVSEHHS
jgi:hypothetical protein